MRPRWRAAALILALAAAVASLGAQSAPQFQGRQPPAPFGPALLKRAGISQEQFAEIRKIYAEAAATTRLAREDLKIQRAELAKALMAAAPARADYERIVKRIAELEVSMRLTRIEEELKIRALIGDEKWAQLRKAIRFLSKDAKEKLKERWLRQGGRK